MQTKYCFSLEIKMWKTRFQQNIEHFPVFISIQKSLYDDDFAKRTI